MSNRDLCLEVISVVEPTLKTAVESECGGGVPPQLLLELCVRASNGAISHENDCDLAVQVLHLAREDESDCVRFCACISICCSAIKYCSMEHTSLRRPC